MLEYQSQILNTDPQDQIPPQMTKLGGLGGNYESVAVDNRNKTRPVLYLTEDTEFGALRKKLKLNQYKLCGYQMNSPIDESGLDIQNWYIQYNSRVMLH